MAIIKETGMYANAINCEKESVGLSGDRNDCVVRAFSLALNKPYEELHTVCSNLGRRKGRRTSQKIIDNVAAAYGMKRVALCQITEPGARFPTLAQFLRAAPPGKYYVQRSGHAFSVIDGVVHDWAKGTGARSRIVRAFVAV